MANSENYQRTYMPGEAAALNAAEGARLWAEADAKNAAESARTVQQQHDVAKAAWVAVGGDAAGFELEWPADRQEWLKQRAAAYEAENKRRFAAMIRNW